MVCCFQRREGRGLGRFLVCCKLVMALVCYFASLIEKQVFRLALGLTLDAIPKVVVVGLTSDGQIQIFEPIMATRFALKQSLF